MEDHILYLKNKELTLSHLAYCFSLQVAEALRNKFRESIAAVTSLHELIELNSDTEIPDCCNGAFDTYYDPRFGTEVRICKKLLNSNLYSY